MVIRKPFHVVTNATDAFHACLHCVLKGYLGGKWYPFSKYSVSGTSSGVMGLFARSTGISGVAAVIARPEGIDKRGLRLGKARARYVIDGGGEATTASVGLSTGIDQIEEQQKIK